MTTTTIRSLSEETLLGFRERAAHHDAVGRFAVADLDELRAAGWFGAALSEELGGLGLSLAEVSSEVRRARSSSRPIRAAASAVARRSATEPRGVMRGLTARPRVHAADAGTGGGSTPDPARVRPVADVPDPWD